MCRTEEAGAQWISAQPGLCGIMWSREVPSSTQATHLPLLKPFWTQSAGSLAEGWTWMEQTKKPTHSQILDQKMPKEVSCIAIYFCVSIISCGALLK